jgi:hypothetical protein
VLLNPILPQRILKRSMYLNDPGPISKSKSSPYINLTLKTQQHALTLVMEDVAMSDVSHVPVYFPAHSPPLTALTAKLNHTSSICVPVRNDCPVYAFFFVFPFVSLSNPHSFVMTVTFLFIPIFHSLTMCLHM